MSNQRHHYIQKCIVCTEMGFKNQNTSKTSKLYLRNGVRTALNNVTLVRPVICHSIYHCTLPLEYIYRQVVLELKIMGFLAFGFLKTSKFQMWFSKCFKQKLNDQFIQAWSNLIDSASSETNYQIFKGLVGF